MARLLKETSRRVIIISGLVIIAALYVFGLFKGEEPAVKIEGFEAVPSSIHSDQTGSLKLRLTNTVDRQQSVKIRFDTSPNVELRSESKQLPKQGNIYTYDLELKAKQKSEYHFDVKAKLDMGEKETIYTIIVHVILEDGKTLTSKADLSVKRR
ncbi:MAG: hypothetical protein NZ919_03020 [Candidatus Caldarchaeum sp.]|nr:hypothetical protein [Candidatus Caldarchaeum sp.]